MSSISSISSSINSMYTSMRANPTKTAADGAAELAISEKTTSQVNGYAQGSENVSAGKAVANTSDGIWGQISDYLDEIKEIAIASINGTASESDKQSMQNQIEQYKQGIADIASTTKYNETTLANGSTSSINIVTDGSGSSLSVSSGNATLEALGIADLDVTGDFDMESIDNAISIASSNRSSLGSQSNALDYVALYNQTAMYNLTAAENSPTLESYLSQSNENQKEQLLTDVSMQMQKNQQQVAMTQTLNLMV